MATIKKRGDKYTAIIRVPDPSKPKGKAQRRVTGRTKGEVEKEIRRILSEVDQGRYITPAKVTIAEYFPKALELHARTKNIREQTFETYSHNLKPILRSIGSWTLAECDSVPLQNWLVDYQKAEGVRNGKPFSGGYMKNICNVLNLCFGVAVRQKILRENPMKEVLVPTGYTKEVREYTGYELSKLEKAWEGERFAPFFMLLRDTGMRLGEAKALRWSDLDWEAKTISITKTRYGNRENAPKSRSGIRTITVDDEVLAELKSWKAVQARDQLKAGEYWKGDYLFSDELGNPITDGTIYYRWGKLCAKAGISYNNPHDLRHTCVSNLLRDGVPDHVVADRVGDSVQTILTIYAHVTRTDDALAAQKVAERRSAWRV